MCWVPPRLRHFDYDAFVLLGARSGPDSLADHPRKKGKEGVWRGKEAGTQRGRSRRVGGEGAGLKKCAGGVERMGRGSGTDEVGCWKNGLTRRVGKSSTQGPSWASSGDKNRGGNFKKKNPGV